MAKRFPHHRNVFIHPLHAFASHIKRKPYSVDIFIVAQGKNEGYGRVEGEGWAVGGLRPDVETKKNLGSSIRHLRRNTNHSESLPPGVHQQRTSP